MSERKLLGLLADANLVGHFAYLLHLLTKFGLLDIFEELSLGFANLGDLGLPADIDDRSLWNYCQQEGWLLFTENRNAIGIDSLQAVLADSWKPGDLPVITLANKLEFEHDAEYRERVASEVAELFFGISLGDYCDGSRIYVPRLPR
ncbi:MAG TPA: hypothetical protein VFI31_21835 [Pirellulales bacterium]|nr:hypothetical protein [Pirellulales bacterium]